MKKIEIINGNFLYELGPGGTNRWDAQFVAAGPEAASPEEVAQIARRFQASEDMYEALKKCVDALDLLLGDTDLEDDGSSEFRAFIEAREALKKAE